MQCQLEEPDFDPESFHPGENGCITETLEDEMFLDYEDQP